MTKKIEELNFLYQKRIKVVGVTFDNHPKNIHKIIKNGLYYKELKRYKGLKDKDLLKQDLSLKEFNREPLSDVLLKSYKYENEDAIKILINDFDDNYLEVGNIPKEEVSNLLPLLTNNNEIIINAYLTGGNSKNILDNALQIEELNIGISLDIIIKEKI